MLSKFFESRRRIHALRDDPAGGLFEGFAQVLSEAGYATSAARRHLRAQNTSFIGPVGVAYQYVS